MLLLVAICFADQSFRLGLTVHWATRNRTGVSRTIEAEPTPGIFLSRRLIAPDSSTQNALASQITLITIWRNKKKKINFPWNISTLWEISRTCFVYLLSTSCPIYFYCLRIWALKNNFISLENFIENIWQIEEI